MPSRDDAIRRRLSRPLPYGAIIAVLVVTGLTASFMFTLVIPIQAQMPDLLNAAREDTAWVVTVTLLAASVMTPIAGRLGDMYGKRRMVLVLLAVMVLGSVISALSADLITMIVGRGLQGAMTGVIPLSISILRDVLPERRVDGSIALLSATMGVGGSLGLPISAFIASVADWHVLFWMSAALGAITFVFVRVIVPVSVLRTAGRFDYLGVAGLALGLVGILLAISRGDQWGWLSLATLGCGLGGILVLVLWAWYQLRTPQPLLDLRIAARKPVLLTNIASVTMGFALFASNVAYPQLLEIPAETGIGFGLPVLIASLVIMPSGMIMMILSPFAGRIARTIGPKVLLIAGAVGLLLAYGYSLFWHSSIWHILIANLIIGFGIGFGYAAMPMLIMRSVPQSETGASNGLNTLFRSIGTTSAAAAIGAVLAATSIEWDGTRLPSAEGFQLSFVLGAAASLVTVVIALFIPSRGAEERRPALPPGV